MLNIGIVLFGLNRTFFVQPLSHHFKPIIIMGKLYMSVVEKNFTLLL